MGNYLGDLFRTIVDAAERVGGLSTNAVLALAVFYLGWKNKKLEETHNEGQRFWGELRNKQAVTDSRNAEAAEKLADAYVKLATIIDERLRRP